MLHPSRLFPATTGARSSGAILASGDAQPGFARQFLRLGLVACSLAVILTGGWIGQQIEQAAINRAAAIAAAYTNSILHTHLRGFPPTGVLGDDVISTLDEIFVSGPLAKKVVRFKLWSSDGAILYSSDAT